MTGIHAVLDILKIQDQHVDLGVVKSAYRKIMLIWHPDKHQGEAAIKAATRKSQEINNAHDILIKHIKAHGPITIRRDSRTATKPKPTASRQSYNKQASRPGFPDKTVSEIFLKSSHIVSAGYRATKRKMYIKFKGGAVYEYSNVPKHIWEDFLAAKSHGKFAHANIYHSFKYRRMP